MSDCLTPIKGGVLATEVQKHEPDVVRVDLGDDHGLGDAREACLRYRSNRTALAAIEIDREQLWNGALRLYTGVEELASRNVPCIASEKGIREGPKGLLFFGGKTQLY